MTNAELIEALLTVNELLQLKIGLQVRIAAGMVFTQYDPGRE